MRNKTRTIKAMCGINWTNHSALVSFIKKKSINSLSTQHRKGSGLTAARIKKIKFKM